MSCSFTAGTVGNDFTPISTVPLVFSSGSVDQVEECTYINTTDDDLIECDEEFQVVLSLATPGISLNLGNNITTVTLIDEDGMFPASLSL